MESAILSLCLALAFLFPSVSVSVEENAPHSNLPFRYELELVANSFQEKLRRELSILEMSMYDDFLKLVKEIDGGHRNITEELTAELTLKVSEVLAKFQKVMIYSTERTKVLNAKMKNLKDSMASWVAQGHTSEGNVPLGLSRRRDTLRGNSDRGKRHTFSFLDDPVLRDIPAARKLLELDPDDFPLVDDIDDIDALLQKLEEINSHVESSGSKYVSKHISPGEKTRFVLARNKKTEGGAKSHLPRIVRPRNCFDLLKEGNTQDGVYLIYPSGKGEGIEVWCDQEDNGGGWTVIIKRQPSDPQLNFTTTPTQYVDGFGRPTSNHWIGLEVMHQLTQGKSHTLRVNLQDFQDNKTYAAYDNFRVGNAGENFTLEVDGYNPASTADDALSIHSGMPFVYPLPSSGEGCSHSLAVGWWFLEYPLCFQALATGPIKDSKSGKNAIGIEWTAWKRNATDIQSLSFMIRPSTG